MQRTRSVRNIILFVLLSAAAGWIGQALNHIMGLTDPNQNVGMLIFLLLPVLTGSVWAVVLLHTASNAVSLALLQDETPDRVSWLGPDTLDPRRGNVSGSQWHIQLWEMTRGGVRNGRDF